MSKLLTVMKSRWFSSAIGLLLLALLVWFGGPFLGIGDSQPLGSAAARLVTILVLLVAWLGVLLLLQARDSAKARKMAGELAAPGAKAGDRDDRSTAERAQLQARFTEAVDTLRKTRRGGSGNLYSLPWYVVIGPPGSGKSTLLLNSGLNFPLSAKFGKEALRGVGGTRNCDWWFTDEAVFLDTAGRYTTQDSDQAADASAWTAFLDLLRRYRKRRPINGVIVAMSVSDLLVLDEAGRAEHVAAIRQRLEELAKHLRIGVPAYLVFTKCDLVAGFTEFFDDLDPAARAQVWGVSFPAAQTMDGSAAKQFGAEFDLLMQRLNTRALDRLHAERDRNVRAAILSFPQQIGALRNIASQFVEGVFAAHQYAQPLLLRGAYLTSGTQEGTPIDRMMSAVSRTFGLDHASVRAPGTKTRTFFVERLLKEVLFKEQGFAGTDPKLERTKSLLQLATYAGVALLSLLLIAGFVTSYGRNKAYLAQVQEALKDAPTEAASGASRQAWFAQVLERLERLDGARQVAAKHEGDVPLGMRFGLYQGRAVGNEVRDAYLREANALLLPGAASQFRAGLVANATDPQALYYYLKGYLMLGQPKHLQKEELEALAAIEWRKLFPADPVLQEALGRHFGALLAAEKGLRPQPLEEPLVEQARSTLRTADLPLLVYGSVKLGGGGTAPPLRLDQALGLLGNVFQRRSGAPLAEPVPALYTQPVFQAQATGGIDEAVKRFAEDDWVFGGTKIDELERARLKQQVIALYEQDYIKAWDALLADLQLLPVADLPGASATAAKLAGPNSPLKRLLMLVRDNTAEMLRAPPEEEGSAAGDAVADAAAKAAKKKAGSSALAKALAKAGGNATPEEAAALPGASITAHFAPLNQLTDGAAGAMPIDQTMAALDQLAKTLLTMGGDMAAAAGQPNAQLLGASQQMAQLPPVVAGMVGPLTGKSEALVASGAKSALDDQYQQMVAKDCATYTRGRYPFAPGSREEIPAQNFGELFGYGGRFDGFYNQTLARLIDASGGSWKWKTGPGAISGSAGLLAQMQAADRIKQMYFRTGSPVPEVGFTFLTPQLDPGIGRLTIEVDGQKYEYTPGGPGGTPMKWPGPVPGRASISAADTAGTLLAKFEYTGDWAFFRALQAGRLARESDVRYAARYDFGGRPVAVTLQAGSLKNPFLKGDLAGFRCDG